MITAAAGFLFASKNDINFLLLLETLLGIAFVIASACVFNNYLDRGIDAKMARTKNRALVSGKISPKIALIYATILGIVGFTILTVFTNWRVVLLGLIAIIVYVIFYGIAKRKTVHGTLVGTIPGAMPPVMGYVAVTNQIDTPAIILFFILVFWQMPHFYAISMYRYKDYKNAGLPVISVSKGMAATKRQTMLYITAFFIAISSLGILGYAGYIYLIAVLALGIYWLWKGISKYHTLEDAKWGKMMFFASLIVNLGMSIVIAIGARLP